MAQMKVTAIRAGYYGLQLRAPGTKFVIEDNSEFSSKWMLKGHQDLDPEELARLERESKRKTQSQLTSATKGTATAASVTVPVSGRASDQSKI